MNRSEYRSLRSQKGSSSHTRQAFIPGMTPYFPLAKNLATVAPLLAYRKDIQKQKADVDDIRHPP
jgi:hypothetical protein